jgi:hypothetical protein
MAVNPERVCKNPVTTLDFAGKFESCSAAFPLMLKKLLLTF